MSEVEVKPFLSFAARPQRAFADALSSVDVPVLPSPWSPKSDEATIATAAVPIDVDAVIAAATARGRDEGHAETAALRARLTSLVERLAAAEAVKTTQLAELAADAACAVVGAWSQVERKEVFDTVLRSWTAKLGPVTARVNPVDAELIEGVALETDATIAPGDIVLSGTTAELVHCWHERLAELRETIVAALEETR